MTMRYDLKRESPSGLWPSEHLETLGHCPVCHNTERDLLHVDLRDRIFFAAAGSWTMWRCNHCQSAYLDPRPDKASIGDAYADYYTHDTASSNTPFHSTKDKIKTFVRNGLRNSLLGTTFKPAFPLGRLPRLVPNHYKLSLSSYFRHLPRLTPGACVLDIGCGNASWLALVHAGGWNAMGMEPDAVARQSAPPGIKVFASLEEIEAQQQRFDHITMNHVIEHVHDPLDVLRSCFKLLKPGGTIYIETPNIDAPTHSQFGPDWRGLEPPRHLVLFSAKALTDALSATQFIAIMPQKRLSSALFLTVQSERIARREDPYAQTTPETDRSVDSTETPEFLSISAQRPL